jgi:hypothetical protein
MKFISKIVSGGQSGADRAALDFAIESEIPHGGWCPKNRQAEDGRIAPVYSLQETPSEGYEQRTEWNVRDSDGTVIFSLAPRLSGGSLMTQKFARSWGKPELHLSQSKISIEKAAELLLGFITKNQIRVLNVAGPRSSKEADVGNFVTAILKQAGL